MNARLPIALALALPASFLPFACAPAARAPDAASLATPAPAPAPPRPSEGAAVAPARPVAPSALDDAARALADAPSSLPPAPVAKRSAKVQHLHGHALVDEYGWLRHKGSPDVLSYLEAENTYAASVMKPTEPLQAALYQEMLARIEENDDTVPYERKGFRYFKRLEKGKSYPIYLRTRADGDGAEETLLDLNELGKKEKFIAVGSVTPTDDGKILAYSTDTTGYRQYTLQFKDLTSGKTMPERIERVTSFAMAKDGRTVYYAVEDPVSKRSTWVFRHTMGQPAATDGRIFEEKDERFDVGVERSRSEELIFVTSVSKTTTEVRYLRADGAPSPLKLFAAREPGHRYFVDHAGGLFYVRSDGKGRNFRVCTATADDTRKAAWREVVAHRDDVMVEDVLLFKDRVVLVEREGGLPQLALLDRQLKNPQRIPFPQAAYDVAPRDNVEYGARTLRFEYESPVDAPAVYDFDLVTGERTLRKQIPVLGGYDPSRYATARIEATAADGTKVPITLVFRKDLRAEGGQPTLLEGYGSYGISEDPGFSAARISLLDRGVLYATAHVRGGGELGKKWHDQGRMMSKMNTFTDFIAAAEHLVAAGYTAKDRLAITGGSAGGLLMGAVTNMRPDLFRVVISRVPFVDVLNTMLDTSLPLTAGEFEEWGNPKVKSHFEYMAKYSPYDNLSAKAYPTMLVKTSYNDSQVMYWEPAKYVARMRALKTNDTPLLLRTNLDPAGHGGPSGRYAKLKDVAYDWAFLVRYLDLPVAPLGSGTARL